MYTEQHLVAGTKTQNLQFTLYDGGSPVAGLLSTDVRLGVASPANVQTRSLRVVTGTWVDHGDGQYSATVILQDDDMYDPYLFLLVRPDPLYVGTLDPLFHLLWNTRNEGAASASVGIRRDRTTWLPVLLQSAGVPQTGEAVTAINSEVAYRKTGGAWSTASLTVDDWVEVGWTVGGATGLYFARLDGILFDVEGMFHLRVDVVAFDSYLRSFPVVRTPKETVRVTVYDQTEDVYEVGVTVFFTPLFGLYQDDVVEYATTDALGRVEVSLDEGDYAVTLYRTGEVFDVNNTVISVRARGTSGYVEETTKSAATLLSDQSPFSIPLGSTLQVRVNGGAIQTVTFDETVIPDVVDELNMDAPTLAAILSTLIAGASAVHGRSADTIGRVILSSLTEGDISSLEIVGGTAAPVMNFPSGVAYGSDNQLGSNYFVLAGESRALTLPAIASTHVEMTLRVVDLEGRPVRGAEVLLVPTEGSSTGYPLVEVEGENAFVSRRELSFRSEHDGYVRNPRTGEKPRILKNFRFDVLIAGTIVRRGIVSPTTPFNLLDRVAEADDPFTIQIPTYPTLPRA